MQTLRRGVSSAMARAERCIGNRATVAVLLVTVGVAGLMGMSVVSGTAGAAPANLLTNGSFETLPAGSTLPGSGYQTVVAGGSTTIPGWTVVTPSTYTGGNIGSVDVVADTYSTVPGLAWNAQDGHYSIDLAGTTGAPGGIYQDVPTTVGATYTLSYYTAVNGDQSPGTSHTVTVSVTGQKPVNVTAVGVGEPLHWVLNTASVVATSPTTRIEFDDTTVPSDVNQGPALDDVSFTPADSLTATPATISPQTTGVSFTAPVATFTDSNTSTPAGSFTATIDWGDGSTTSGNIAGSGGSFSVSGTHTYTAHNSYTVGVSIASTSGASASVSDSVVVADAVTTCSASGCTGSVTTAQQTVGISSASTSGTILTTVDPADQAGISCGDSFRHAPEVTTVTDTGLNANILYTVTFKNTAAAGQWFVPFAVCYQAQTPFRDLNGHSVTTGLLPVCTLIPRPNNPLVAPCVQSITELPLFRGNVVEKIVVPAGDPRFH
jgi:hypothetical protein